MQTDPPVSITAKIDQDVMSNISIIIYHANRKAQNGNSDFKRQI